jgi:hypothetical protein
MTGTIHELRPRTVQQMQDAIAPILPALPHIIDLTIQFERMRHTAETALAVLRACPAGIQAHTAHLDQIMGAYFDAEAANGRLADLLQCEGQA